MNSLASTTIYALSRRLFQLGSRSRAEEIFRAAQTTHPNDFWINKGLSEVLQDTPGRREEAIGFLRAALALKPESVGVRNNLGLLLTAPGPAGAGGPRTPRGALPPP